MKMLDVLGTLRLGCLGLLTVFAPPIGAQVTVEFTNPGLIEINTPRLPGNDGRARPSRATPYPSTINVSGFLASETIDKVTVTLHDLFHEVPDDVDILLVGPEGQNIVLLSDAGGSNFGDIHVSATLTLDDDAEESVPDDESLTPGRFKPSNYEIDEDDDSDVFPEPLDENDFPTGPAPEPSPATRLSVFAGTHPNGEWRLYVVDDEVFDAGSIGEGWSLTIRAATQATPFRRGDTNQDGALNLTDAILTLTALFLGGAQPACTNAADADDDGSVSLTDAVYTLGHLFRGGPAPPAPGAAACGTDPTEDGLSCESLLPCHNQCPGALRLCNGSCVDTNFDPQNCGACGVVCGDGETCSGVCVAVEPL